MFCRAANSRQLSPRRHITPQKSPVRPCHDGRHQSPSLDQEWQTPSRITPSRQDSRYQSPTFNPRYKSPTMFTGQNSPGQDSHQSTPHVRHKSPSILKDPSLSLLRHMSPAASRPWSTSSTATAQTQNQQRAAGNFRLPLGQGSHPTVTRPGVYVNVSDTYAPANQSSRQVE